MKDLIARIKRAEFVFVCGNGGSAATAEHLTNDLFSRGIKAICLNSNTSIITMIANDFGYEYIFSKQLELYGNEDCLLITISCSGTSPNIVNAIRLAELIGMDWEPFESAEEGKEIDYGGLENHHMEMVHKIKDSL